MNSSASPLVSVISLTHNRAKHITNLLHALRCQDYQPREVIVLDNASTDGTAALIRSDFPEVHLIEVESNLGNYAYNLGFQAAHGEYCLMMDDDGLPASDDWITQVVTRFERNARLAVVACTVRMQDTGRLAPDSPQFIPEQDGADGYPCAAYNGTGVGLRTPAIQELACLYPQECFHIFVELHLCTRLIERGWAVRLFPEIEVWHCRTSGSSNPPLSIKGLSNYCWYIWNLYPWPDVATETLHQFSNGAKLVWQKEITPRLFLSALREAFRGGPSAFQSRQAVSLDTIDYLRMIRHHNNWHRIAPEVTSFQAPAAIQGKQ